MEEEFVTISREEYDKLTEESQKLSALECAGVDNWCGYDEAMEMVREWNEDN